MKIVAVSQRTDLITDRNEERDGLDQQLIKFLSIIGLVAVPVPNCLSIDLLSKNNASITLKTWLEIVKPSAFVLSGGNDIGKSEKRDKTEYFLLDYAKKNELPLLGICRGMQIMAHWAGTNLKKINGHIRTRHTISGDVRMEVNSFHSLGLETCPVEYEVLALSEDGEIEAIRHRNLPWEGWMWHPERELNFSKQDITRAENIFFDKKII